VKSVIRLLERYIFIANICKMAVVSGLKIVIFFRTYSSKRLIPPFEKRGIRGIYYARKHYFHTDAIFKPYNAGKKVDIR